MSDHGVREFPDNRLLNLAFAMPGLAPAKTWYEAVQDVDALAETYVRQANQFLDKIEPRAGSPISFGLRPHGAHRWITRELGALDAQIQWHVAGRTRAVLEPRMRRSAQHQGASGR